MMIGIVSYGAYVPYYRLDRSVISNAWKTPFGKGERAVANSDEDSVTMAVAAGRNCIRGIDKSTIDAVYFASTTFPYNEKMAATVLKGAFGLGSTVRAVDFSNSLKAGTSALISAMDAVRSGSARNVLVVCSDMRMGYPKGKNEASFGDGAAAVLVGEAPLIAVINEFVSISEEFYGSWRSDGEMFIRHSEERLDRETGFMDVLPRAISAVMQKADMAPKDISKVAFDGPDAGQIRGVHKKMSFDMKGGQVQNSLFAEIGFTGVAAPFMILIAALEDAAADETLLMASYGDGADAFVLKTTKEIEGAKKRRGIKHYQADGNKKRLDDYMKYVLWRGLMPTEPPPRPPQPMVSIAALWRDRDWGLALRGVKCLNCGTIQFPVQRVCVKCEATDQFEPYEFSNRVGRLTTFSHDNLAAAVDPPTTICAVDFEEGGRIMCDMTDRDMDEVRTGMKVEMSFRRLHVVGGVHNYYWKCVPWRG